MVKLKTIGLLLSLFSSTINALLISMIWSPKPKNLLDDLNPPKFEENNSVETEMRRDVGKFQDLHQTTFRQSKIPFNTIWTKKKKRKTKQNNCIEIWIHQVIKKFGGQLRKMNVTVSNFDEDEPWSFSFFHLESIKILPKWSECSSEYSCVVCSPRWEAHCLRAVFWVVFVLNQTAKKVYFQGKGVEFIGKLDIWFKIDGAFNNTSRDIQRKNGWRGLWFFVPSEIKQRGKTPPSQRVFHSSLEFMGDRRLVPSFQLAVFNWLY